MNEFGAKFFHRKRNASQRGNASRKNQGKVQSKKLQISTAFPIVEKLLRQPAEQGNSMPSLIKQALFSMGNSSRAVLRLVVTFTPDGAACYLAINCLFAGEYLLSEA
jgi:hypothetical protein